MKGILTILIIFSTLLYANGQSKDHSADSVLKRTLKRADSTQVKATRLNNKINTKTQVVEQKVEKVNQVLKGNIPTNTSTEVDSTQLKRKTDADKIKRQSQIADQKYDSVMRTLAADKKRDRFKGVDSADQKVNSTANKIKLKSQGADHKLDSVNGKLTGGLDNKLSVLDSGNQKITNTKNRIQQKQTKYTDSLDAITNKYEQKLKLDKLKTLTDKVNSKTLPDNKYTNKLDSIANINPLEKTKSKVTEVESKIKNIGDKPKTKIDEKINLLSKESGGKGNLPAEVNMPNTGVDGITGKMPGDVKMPDTGIDMNQKLPGIDQPSINKPDASLNKDINPNLNLSKDIVKTPDLNKVNDLKKGTAEVGAATDKVKGYTEDVKNIENGDIDKVKTLKEDALAKVPVKDELTEIQKQDKLFKEQQAQIESFKNPEAFKKHTLARSNEMVAKQMAAFAPQIQEAVSKVTKNQGKLGTVLAHTKDLPKQRDKLKKLKPYERITPGLTLQIQKPGAWLVDINPSLRYRITSYWSAGAGWNERTVFGHYALEQKQTRVYGVRAFTEVVIFKGLSLRLDAEDMNAFIGPRHVVQDNVKRDWVWSYMVGVKKDFSFVPRVIGNVQFMYNVYSSNRYNPYPTAFNVRFGFEPVLKKRKRKVNKIKD